MLMVAHVGEGGVKIGQKRAHVVYGRSHIASQFVHFAPVNGNAKLKTMGQIGTSSKNAIAPIRPI